jgi:hypothetical protein
MNTSYETKDNKDEWLTPPYIFEALQPFDLDVCQPVLPPWKIAPRGFDELDDGLAQSWGGGVYMVQPTIRQTNPKVAG